MDLWLWKGKFTDEIQKVTFEVSDWKISMHYDWRQQKM